MLLELTKRNKMSKYNIDEMVYHSSPSVEYIKNELKTTDFIDQKAHKFARETIDKISTMCLVVLTDDAIVFNTNLRQDILRKESYPKMIYARNYVRKMLYDLGVDTYVYHDIKYCDNVYVPLREPNNKQLLKHLENVLKFKYETPVLTQSILDSMKQNRR